MPVLPSGGAGTGASGPPRVRRDHRALGRHRDPRLSQPPRGWRGPGLHTRVHDWAGGTMTSGASPNDPMFGLHHCYLDSLWARWRPAHPTAGYLSATRTAGVVALDEPMPPCNDATPRDMLDHTRFYRYG